MRVIMLMMLASVKPKAPPCTSSFHLELCKAGITIDAENSITATNNINTVRFTLFFTRLN